MAKKPIRPLFDVKHDFVDSLDAFIQQAINLQLAVKTALDLNQVAEPCAKQLRERIAAFETATLSSN